MTTDIPSVRGVSKCTCLYSWHSNRNGLGEEVSAEKQLHH